MPGGGVADASGSLDLNFGPFAGEIGLDYNIGAPIFRVELNAGLDQNPVWHRNALCG